ncbi:MAG: site-2 protease family protein, partial [Blastocatellia bacterium]
ALATSVLFFLSLLAHEMSHCLVALAKGLPVRSITLFIFGGVSRIEKDATSAATEFLVGVVGPLSSFVVALGFLVVSGVFDPRSPMGAMCFWLWLINVWLAVFNMIPGYPMDGGRVLRAAIWAVTDNVNKATRIAARIGQFFGYGMIVFGIGFALLTGSLLGGLWVAFIGFFLLEAARRSRDAAVFEHVITGVHASDLMNAGAPLVPSNITLSEFFDDYLMRTGNRCFIISEDGRLLGLLTPQDLKDVPREHWSAIPVIRAMKPFEATRWVEPNTDLNKVIEVMEQDNVGQVPVVSDGHLEGLVRREDVMRFIQTRAEFDY